MRNPQGFASAIRDRMAELNMSAPDVVRAARNRVSTSTVWNIANGRVRNVASETIITLAFALKMSEDELFNIAYRLEGSKDDPGELKLVIYYRNLPDERQGDLLMIASGLHRKYGLKPAEAIRAEIRSQTRKAA